MNVTASPQHPIDSPKRTPLYDLAIAKNARMTEFAGWEMPVQYSGISQEHQAVRQHAGLFDISHMGKFVLQGQDLISSLQKLVPSDLARLEPGAAQYSVLLNSEAGIIDDLIVYYQGLNAQGQPQAVLIVNASTAEQDKTWIESQLQGSDVRLVDLTLDRALIAIQGPKAVSTLQALVEEDLSTIQAFGHRTITLLSHPAFVARTGYTGEDGFEIMIDPSIVGELWQRLQAAGVVPCGLGARDTLRLEAAMALYGQDIDQQTTPLEAGLGWLVHLESKGDFIGRSTLERQKQTGVKRRLVGLQLPGRNIARHHYPVLSAGQVVGTVTSGTLSPTLGYPVALAYVPTELSKPGQILDIEIRSKTYPATVVKRPFYRRAS
jgi:aminomethyltransferase